MFRTKSPMLVIEPEEMKIMIIKIITDASAI